MMTCTTGKSLTLYMIALYMRLLTFVPALFYNLDTQIHSLTVSFATTDSHSEIKTDMCHFCSLFLQCYDAFHWIKGVWHVHTVLTAIFQINLGWTVPLILHFHSFLSWASSWDRPKLFISPLSIPRGIPGRSVCRVPSVFIDIHHLAQSASSLRSTCPNHRSLLLLTDILVTVAVIF